MWNSGTSRATWLASQIRSCAYEAGTTHGSGIGLPQAARGCAGQVGQTRSTYSTHRPRCRQPGLGPAGGGAGRRARSSTAPRRCGRPRSAARSRRAPLPRPGQPRDRRRDGRGRLRRRRFVGRRPPAGWPPARPSRPRSASRRGCASAAGPDRLATRRSAAPRPASCRRGRRSRLDADLGHAEHRRARSRRSSVSSPARGRHLVRPGAAVAASGPAAAAVTRRPARITSASGGGDHHLRAEVRRRAAAERLGPVDRADAPGARGGRRRPAPRRRPPPDRALVDPAQHEVADRDQFPPVRSVSDRSAATTSSVPLARCRRWLWNTAGSGPRTTIRP